MSEMTKAERIRLIAKTIRDCGEMVTQEAIAKQYRYETGEDLYAEKELPWEK